MNRARKSRLSVIAVVLLVPMAIVGCNNNCELCMWVCSPFGAIPRFIGFILYGIVMSLLHGRWWSLSRGTNPTL